MVARAVGDTECRPQFNVYSDSVWLAPESQALSPHWRSQQQSNSPVSTGPLATPGLAAAGSICPSVLNPGDSQRSMRSCFSQPSITTWNANRLTGEVRVARGRYGLAPHLSQDSTDVGSSRSLVGRRGSLQSCRPTDVS